MEIAKKRKAELQLTHDDVEENHGDKLEKDRYISQKHYYFCCLLVGFSLTFFKYLHFSGSAAAEETKIETKPEPSVGGGGMEIAVL
jgi:hypothetical protein